MKSLLILFILLIGPCLMASAQDEDYLQMAFESLHSLEHNQELRAGLINHFQESMQSSYHTNVSTIKRAVDDIKAAYASVDISNGLTHEYFEYLFYNYAVILLTIEAQGEFLATDINMNMGPDRGAHTFPEGRVDLVIDSLERSVGIIAKVTPKPIKSLASGVGVALALPTFGLFSMGADFIDRYKADPAHELKVMYHRTRTQERLMEGLVRMLRLTGLQSIPMNPVGIARERRQISGMNEGLIKLVDFCRTQS